MTKVEDELVEKISKPKKGKGGKPTMKTFIKNNWKVLVTILVMSALVVGSYKIFYMGVNYEATKQRTINQKVENAVKQVSVETSKQ